MSRRQRAGAARSLGRTLRRWRRSLRPLRARFVYSRGYRMDLPGLPYDPLRAERILAFLAREGLVRRRTLHRPGPASLRALRRIHTDAYLEALREPPALTPILGFEPSDLQRERVLEVQRAMVGGTLLATRLALQGAGPAVNLAGGLHHAFPDRGHGFCVFDDAAVAVAAARARGFRGRVLVADLDLHDGDGTRAIFAADPGVFTLSIHNRTLDGAPAVASLALELGDGVGDGAYLAAVREHLPAVVRAFRPELVFYLAGVDVAAGDAIGDWRISPAAILERDRYVASELRRHLGRVPLVVLLAGGYGEEAWRHSARSFAWLAGGRALEPPSTEEATVLRYRRLARLVPLDELAGEPGEAGFGLTPEDLQAALGEGGRRTRLLGHFSKHGIELALDRLGLLERLRGLGFSQPTLEFDLDNPSGETVCLYGDPDRKELLAEIRMGRDRTTLRGSELLRIEWLLLQNPRGHFTPERPRLPGQRLPGLGLLKDLMALLILVCEGLGLDGIVFVPGHYHLAAQSKAFLRFLDPEDEGRFRALQSALGELSLAEVSRAVAEGRVVDRAAGEVLTWPAKPMVLATSAILRGRLEGAGYESRARAAAERHSFALRDAPS